MDRRARWTVALALLGAVAMAAPSARADDKDEARRAAQAGSEAFRAGHHDEALTRFEEAERLVHAPTHQLMMARSQRALGHWTEALRLYAAAAAEATDASTPPAFVRARDDAKREAAELDAKVPRVTIVVEPKSAPRLVVRRDGAVVAAAALTAPLPLDPGRHQFSATADGMKSDTVTLEIAEGERHVVELELVAKAAPPAASPQPARATKAAPAPAAGAPGPVSEPPQAALRGPSIAAMALGAGGLFVGAALLPVAATRRTAADRERSACASGCSADAASHAQRTDDAAGSLDTAAKASLVAGGILLGGGLVMLVVSATGESKESSAAVVPLVGPGAIGARGRF